ncbi:hypothetical protein MtrunA17_Chr3g0093081 [Medicago truncatula]|uniref:Transmembrane protein n=1 Tax=Medicago truncatula TaxID=3880 RepID=A0A396IPE6_MEDTR|nr:hypothetical protein MtrunA17_Chr3g0093081 [Medicago truncatula]
MTSSVKSFEWTNQISSHDTSDVRTNYNMDHLLHMFHRGQVYFKILTVRFTWCLCYCGTPFTHDFSYNSKSLSSLSLMHLSYFFIFFIYTYYLPSIFLSNHHVTLQHLHHTFIIFIFFV